MSAITDKIARLTAEDNGELNGIVNGGLLAEILNDIAAAAEAGGISATTVELAIRFHWDENEEEVIQQITKNTTGISDFVVIRNSVGNFTIQSESTWVTALQVLVSVSGGMVIPRYALNNSTDIQILSVDPAGNWMDDQIEYSVLVIKNIE